MQYWYDFYRDANEAIPEVAPNTKRNVVSTYCFVDEDHAGDRATRRLQTGVLIFLNKAPIIWNSKRQKNVKTSTFSSDFIALKTATELVQAIWYN